MKPQLLLIVVLFLHGISCVAEAGKKDVRKVPSLKSSGQSNLENGERIRFGTISRIKKVGTIRDWIELIAQKDPERALRILRDEDSSEILASPALRFTYKLINDSAVDVKINFSEWRIVHSPLTDIWQDFFCVVPAGKKRVISFVSFERKSTTTAINIGGWNTDAEKWDFIGAGQCSLFHPGALSLYVDPTNDVK